MKTVEQIIKTLNLLPHPEGGYYKETYRSTGSIKADSLPEAYGGERNYCTGIYFLLTSDTFSAFHKIKQDEMWHFYDGTTIELHVISESGEHSKHLIGNNFEIDTLIYTEGGKNIQRSLRFASIFGIGVFKVTKLLNGIEIYFHSFTTVDKLIARLELSDSFHIDQFDYYDRRKNWKCRLEE